MREFLKAYWPFVGIGLLGLLIAVWIIEPAPPRKISFAAGPQGGAYYAFAERYQRLLADQGIEMEIQQTAGSVENLRLLSEEGVDVALVQGGLANRDQDPTLGALGGFFPEPVWVFVRDDFPVSEFGDLQDARMAIGATGSGTRALALSLQHNWGGTWSSLAQSDLSGAAARQALEAGDIDAALFVAALDAPYITPLLKAENIHLLAFPRADALARRSPSLAKTILLQGVVDIGQNIPATDIPLIAPAAQILVAEDTHPAIQAVLMDATTSIHADGSWLAPTGTYPDARLSDLPLTKEAKRYYRSGPTALRRWFSFGMANFLERAWVLLIPLITLMIPLVRVAPPIYRWRVRRRIYVWYSDLRALEVKGRAASSHGERQEIISKLHRLQVDAGKIEVPLSYTDDLYRLRNHIEFVEGLIKTLAPDERLTKEQAEAALNQPSV